MKRAVIYARYSSNNQTEQSIEGQIHVCNEYAERKGLIVVGEYIDRAISGRTDNRPDFQRMIKDCGRNLFDAVIVYKTDRFARNKYDSAIYKRELRHAGIELHYAAETIPDGPEGIILESLMEGLAEYYSAELSQKIRRGMRESALKGHSTGGVLALGYKVAEDKSYEIHPEEAKAVQTIFKMLIEGATNVEICTYLNGLGLRTSKGNIFNKNSIPRIIQNEKYIGVYKCGDIRIENAVPAIVEKEVFYMAQKELEKRRTSKQVASSRINYLLSGKLFCGHCKKNMIGVSGTGKLGKKYYYYYCPEARRKKGCTKKHVAKDWLEKLVVEETIRHILQPDAIAYISKACYDIQLADSSQNDELVFYKQKISSTKKAIANTLRAIETGVSTTTLPERLRELEIELVQLKKEEENAKSRDVIITPDEIAFLLEQYAAPKEDEETYRKKVIDSFVSKVYLYDDKLLVVYNISPEREDIASSMIELLEKSECERVRPATQHLHQIITLIVIKRKSLDFKGFLLF